MKKYSLYIPPKQYNSPAAITKLLYSNPYAVFDVPVKHKSKFFALLRQHLKLDNTTIERQLKDRIVYSEGGQTVNLKIKSISPMRVLTSTSYGYIIALLFLTGRLHISHLNRYLREVYPTTKPYNVKQFLSLNLKRDTKFALLDAIGISEYDYLAAYKQLSTIHLLASYNEEVDKWVNDKALYSPNHSAEVRTVYNYQYEAQFVNKWHYIEGRNNITQADQIVTRWLRDNVMLYNDVSNYIDLDNLMKLHFSVHMNYSHNSIINNEAVLDLSEIDNIYSNIYAEVNDKGNKLVPALDDISHIKQISVRDIKTILGKVDDDEEV